MSKLVSMTLVHNELHRYLPLWLDHMLSFVDEVRIIDDGSTDGTSEWLAEQARADERVQVERLPACQMFDHEGRAKQLLLDFAMVGHPDVLLALDADEFLSDPAAVRAAAESPGLLWTLVIEEVWRSERTELWTREDGGWRQHPVPIMVRVPGLRHRRDWRAEDKQLACSRTPLYVRSHIRSAKACGSSLLHFGWSRKRERAARYARYVVKDGGRFHASQHLKSIMLPDRQTRQQPRPWPDALAALRAAETAQG